MLLAVLIFAAILAFFFGFYAQARGRARDEEHISSRLRAISRDSSEVETRSLLQEESHSDLAWLHGLLGRVRATADLEQLVRQAGLKARVGLVVLWMVLLGSVFGAGAIMLGRSPLVAGGVFALGPFVIVKWLRRRRRSRKETIMRQVPDVMEMMRSSLQAGHSLNQAFEVISQEAPELIATQFRQVLEELRLGNSMKAALFGVLDRTGVEDLRFFVVAVLLNREIGGNLSDILGSVSQTLRERFKLKAQVKAMTSQGRFTAKLLSCLPPAVLCALTAISPRFTDPLFTKPPGQIALGIAVTLIVVGYIVMNKMVNIKAVRVD